MVFASVPVASAQGGSYTVQPGDTLAKISQKFGVSSAAIMSANGLTNPNLIVVGQKLVIPGGGAPAPAPKPTTTTYTVQPGDTLSKIAQKFRVAPAAIMSANGLTNANLIRVGQKLVIPGASGAAPAPQPAPKPASQTRYTVRSGDTLGSIAVRFGVSTAALQQANGITNPNLIFPGKVLVIPPGTTGPGAVSGRASKFVASISQQRCWVYQGETIIYEWVCSTGRRSSPSVPGTYKVQSKLSKAYGSAWNIWMPYWLGIYWAGSTENGIHGMPWNATTGAKTWPGLVGTPITYGCIMLNDWQAKTLWDMAWIGMPVVIKR
jgi:LysM repeat protein